MARGNRVIREPESWRARLVLVCFMIFAVVLAGRAIDLQVLDRGFLAGEGVKRHVRTLDVPGGRGAILDRRGEPLALSAPVESVWAVPDEALKNVNQLPPLAKLLDMPTEKLVASLNKRSGKGFMYLQRHLTPADARRVMALEVPGVFLQREYRRYYPAGEAAAQLVGFTNIDTHGQEGVELALESLLHGEKGSRRVIKDRVGRVVEDLAEFKPPQAGQDVRLSIDLRLQYIAYRELKRAVSEENAKSGMVVVADPDNGEILAIASYPSYNPNRRDSVKSTGLRNRAAVDTFEPGSTVKPLVVALGIESGLFNKKSVIKTDGGRFRVGRLLVKDFRDYGPVDLGRLLMKSSNVGAAKIGLAMGAEQLWKGYQSLGFGDASGVGFPGESGGVLHDHRHWGQIGTATASYGYSLSVTALQLTRAYCAIANGGVLPTMTILRDYGSNISGKRVMSAHTARDVRGFMESVVTNQGTARRAAVTGYRVAGKTGTARKVAKTGGYDHDAHQGLFIGMVPADEPELVVMVLIDEPGKGQYYGGAVAAPVFSNVMRGSLRTLQIPPQITTDPTLTTAGQKDREART